MYLNSDLDKFNILNDNKNKQGIYLWINTVNDKIYVGSSMNLTTRFYKYYSVKNLTLHNTIIHNALLKYGFSSFSLAILDNEDNGVILTSLHTRDRTRVYMKEVANGHSESDTSSEEKRALAAAQKRNK